MINLIVNDIFYDKLPWGYRLYLQNFREIDY